MMNSFVVRASTLLARLVLRSRRAVGDHHRLAVTKLSDILTRQPTVTLRSLAFCDGNVSPLELLVITALVADRAPECIFELGTFNGNTTLQMAENAPVEAEVFTLDLPLIPISTTRVVDEADVKYIQSDVRTTRRYVGTPPAGKIRELFGDSALFDFQAALGTRKIDFAFIDGSHSYEYVKSDTTKIFEHLAPDAIVLWHDYVPYWHGVCKYLNELQSTRLLFQIEGTTLAYYRHAV